MQSIAAPDFALKATLESGQLFRYRLGSNGFYNVVVGDSIIKLKQHGNGVVFSGASSDFDVKRFLGLRQQYSRIVDSISRDEKISAAVRRHYGLRILEQEPWECTASFVCSSFSNIPRIRQCIENVSTSFGDEVSFDGITAFSFPRPHQINDFSKLSKCGLGYRAKYLFETARIFANSGGEYSLRQMRKLDYVNAKKKLLELPGVGEKVADCILLFSYGFLGAFPVDVWVHRAMVGSYRDELSKFAAAKNSGKITVKAVAGFARNYFGEYAGYAQQFLFHNIRTSTYKKKLPLASLFPYSESR